MGGVYARREVSLEALTRANRESNTEKETGLVAIFVSSFTYPFTDL